MFRNEKIKFYNNLNINKKTDSRKFWSQVKPFFPDKSASKNNITLIESNEIISDDKECAEVMNNFFSDVVENLGIDRYLNTVISNDTNDPISKAINKYKTHPSILKIREHIHSDHTFYFQTLSNDEVEKQLSQLDTSKAFQADVIPPKILEENSDIFSKILTDDLNNSIATAKCPDNLLCADITPAFKKDDWLIKSNYRPISI